MPTDSVVHQLAIRVSNRLRDERLMLATAESCTGGMVATAITDISGSSGWFERGFVTYSNQAKSEMIGVRADLIEKHGAVSEQVARAMAEGALRNSRAQVSVSITGVAGPGGGTKTKPVGMVSFGWSNRLHTSVETKIFKGDREQIRVQAAAHALRGVLALLDELNTDLHTAHESESMSDLNATQHELIRRLGLTPHPEGGFFREIYRSAARVFREDDSSQTRSASTAIYYLLCDGAHSAWHRIQSDEVWHFYAGETLNVHVLDEQGTLVTHRLGNALTHADAAFQAVVPAGLWFAAECADPSTFALVGCTVAPGFEFSEFELAAVDALKAQHPQHAALIGRLGPMSKPGSLLEP